MATRSSRSRSSRSGVLLLSSVVLVVSMSMIAQAAKVGLYDSDIDHILTLDASTFDKEVYGSSRAHFVEFYAHWCGGCQSYAKHWKQIALETKPWHETVVRVAAVNCGDQSTYQQLCKKHDVTGFPTLKYYAPMASYSSPGHGGQVVDRGSDEDTVKNVLEQLEAERNRPDTWPALEPLKAPASLGELFAAAKSRNVRYAFVVLEEKSSWVGRHVALHTAHLVPLGIQVRRVIEDANKPLFDKMLANPDDRSLLPRVYVVENTGEASGTKTTFRAFSEASDQTAKAIADSIVYFLDKNGIAKSNDGGGGGGSPVDVPPANRAGQVNSSNAQASASGHMNNHIAMEDLESALNMMIRTDMSSSKQLRGPKLAALKDWLRVLSKFYPGREQVRNYLKHLNDKVSSDDVKSVSSDEWTTWTNLNESYAFLPQNVEWRHCQGSDPTFRGYPCSLWTLFHVLTVSQIEMEKSKAKPFDKDYRVSEVVEGIRLFVLNFFTCRECASNFELEIDGYQNHLVKPHDAVIYMWRVHNSVNRRLYADPKSQHDPHHPKVQFPTRIQCPKCYMRSLPGIQANKDKQTNLVDEDGTRWNMRYVLGFLRSFYSRANILPHSSASAAEPNKQPGVPRGLKPAADSDNKKNGDQYDEYFALEKGLTDDLDDDLARFSMGLKSASVPSVFDAKSIMFVLFLCAMLVTFLAYFGLLKRKYKSLKHIV